MRGTLTVAGRDQGLRNPDGRGDRGVTVVLSLGRGEVVPERGVRVVFIPVTSSRRITADDFAGYGISLLVSVVVPWGVAAHNLQRTLIQPGLLSLV